MDRVDDTSPPVEQTLADQVAGRCTPQTEPGANFNPVDVVLLETGLKKIYQKNKFDGTSMLSPNNGSDNSISRETLLVCSPMAIDERIGAFEGSCDEDDWGEISDTEEPSTSSDGDEPLPADEGDDIARDRNNHFTEDNRDEKEKTVENTMKVGEKMGFVGKNAGKIKELLLNLNVGKNNLREGKRRKKVVTKFGEDRESVSNEVCLNWNIRGSNSAEKTAILRSLVR